jgi:transcriptional regulator GlxA family with amidase domain
MQIRLEKAAQLLVTTTDTIQSIALSAGFHDHAYFTKLFKRAYNKTPKTYREEYQQL